MLRDHVPWRIFPQTHVYLLKDLSGAVALVSTREDEAAVVSLLLLRHPLWGEPVRSVLALVTMRLAVFVVLHPCVAQLALGEAVAARQAAMCTRVNPFDVLTAEWMLVFGVTSMIQTVL